MKFFSAFAALMMATSAAANDQKHYIRNLMKGAQPTENSQLGRNLDQEEYKVDISKYSVKFEQCQFVKTYNAEMAEEEDTTTVLATQRFVLFRLCPGDCDSCNYNYGEYLVDLETYLQATVEYYQEYQEEMCNACDECQNNQYQNQDADQNDQQDNGDNNDQQNRKLQQYNVDCNSCYDECYKIENMEANGYVDATEFLECQMIYDPEDDNRAPLYAGPICASSGSRIKIGVFSDEECLMLDSSKDVDDYLVNDNGQMKLSHALLKNTYTNTCISCKEPQEWDENQDDNNQNNDNDQQDADAVIEMCENLYDAAAKCEKSHGFDDGYANYYGYENQISQEETVCDFMTSLKSGTYDEEGEIIVSGASSVAGSDSTTGGQKFALTFFILGTVALAVYAAMLHSKLVKGGTADLSSSGGAMA